MLSPPPPYSNSTFPLAPHPLPSALPPPPPLLLFWLLCDLSPLSLSLARTRNRTCLFVWSWPFARWIGGVVTEQYLSTQGWSFALRVPCCLISMRVFGFVILKGLSFGGRSKKLTVFGTFIFRASVPEGFDCLLRVLF